jgi:hypothetical protein
MYILRSALLVASLVAAYRIRLYAVRDYGRVIHEFDPWFNFRATQYLVDNGREKFFKWFDHSVWYPLGRPVGTTIYPGMQFTAAGIYNALNAIPDVTVSLNDVCVFMPAAFSVLASLFTGGIAWEAASEGNKASSAVVAIAVMAIQPGHLMRSVAGAFDNESVAVTAITGTFYWWVRSLRTQKSWQFAFIAAASYFYMVAAWGGYTFVVNMIGVHAGVSMLAGRFSFKLWRSYSIFYALGTAAATRVPVVGMMPFQSMEQMGPLFVFFMCQLYAVSESRRKTLSDREYETFRKRLTSVGVGVAAVIIGARSRALRPAHAHREPARGLRRGAPSDARRRVREVLPLQRPHGAVRRIRVPAVPTHGRARLRGVLLSRVVVLLEQDGQARVAPRARGRGVDGHRARCRHRVGRGGGGDVRGDSIGSGRGARQRRGRGEDPARRDPRRPRRAPRDG